MKSSPGTVVLYHSLAGLGATQEVLIEMLARAQSMNCSRELMH
jgi:hypothetical protein